MFHPSWGWNPNLNIKFICFMHSSYTWPMWVWMRLLSKMWSLSFLLLPPMPSSFAIRDSPSRTVSSICCLGHGILSYNRKIIHSLMITLCNFLWSYIFTVTGHIVRLTAVMSMLKKFPMLEYSRIQIFRLEMSNQYYIYFCRGRGSRFRQVFTL